MRKTKWEMLPPKIQKVIMLLIYRSQYERGLKLGPFGVGINRECFVTSEKKKKIILIVMLGVRTDLDFIVTHSPQIKNKINLNE